MNVPKVTRPKPAATRVRAAALAGAAVLVSGLAACSALSGTPGTARQSGTAGPVAQPSISQPPAAHTRVPSSPVAVIPGRAPGDLTAAFARTLFTEVPVVVVADPGSSTALAGAARAARAAHAPLLLASRVTPRLAATVLALHPLAVLAAGLPPGQLARRLPGVRVVSSAARLPATAAPAPLRQLAVLIPSPVPVGPAAGKGTAARKAPAAIAGQAVITAVTATVQAAGATILTVPGSGDPRADPAVIRALARLHPRDVIAVGRQFAPAARLQARLAVAETGSQLPDGGQLMFPGRRLVALYGHPGAPGLGVLGHQDLAASIARAKRMAAAYRPLSGVPVIPAFEIIATVAEAAPGPDGTYSAVTPVSQLLPWVKAATAAGLYVVLDLQPGRASLLAQARDYQSLLRLPGVGLALDPEWKLTPGQQPLHQIGHVDITEVNSVIRWLAVLTARYHLPQKLLVLHQFRLDMLPGEGALDTSHDDLAIVLHMDGQGTPGQKQATWDAVTAAAPRGVYFGFKDFFVMDHPMLTPRQTMTHAPAPVMISYQ